MDSFALALASALWLGILTSISPCPLATNIAAISYIGKRVDRPRYILFSGLLYMLGRMLAYFAVALIVVGGVSAIPALANGLQQHMNRLLGPVLILAGLLLLDVLPLPWRSGGVSERMKARVESMGIFGALLLGVAFALAFCPVSAALFFGSLIPLALANQSSVAMPLAYGLGTAAPVAAFAIILAFAIGKLSAAFDLLGKAERWMRRATAVVFIAVGGYYSYLFLF